MRIRRLDLIRYGHFTGFDFKLPATQPDFHVVFGPNEAGKSTALSAIEDLLFGIPHNSSRNFLHDYNSMRIGALLERGGETLELQRRKGNRDTLLDKNGTPLPTGDAALVGLLAGADKAFFTRMFCLDHERLRTGGQEIGAVPRSFSQCRWTNSIGGGRTLMGSDSALLLRLAAKSLLLIAVTSALGAKEDPVVQPYFRLLRQQS
jgi:DNA repair exonuclease SbcCD ATPase subunit